MEQDNTTPMNAASYDNGIFNTIPYLAEFYQQTFDVIKQYQTGQLHWLDLGCGTGLLEKLAFEEFEVPEFVLVDPSEQMIEQAKEKLATLPASPIQYICSSSETIAFDNCFEVVTAIQSHHYMKKPEREKATKHVYKALKPGGIYISFENVVSSDEEVKAKELLRWGRYMQAHGKSPEETKVHNDRCGVNYFPITVEDHISLLKECGFRHIHVFWYSYMQMGIYGIK